MATIKDVAQTAQVSIATVSRFFSDPQKLQPSTRERVRQIVERLEYLPNTLASMLKSNKSNIYGMFISDAKNIFFNMLIEKLNKKLNARGKHLFVFYDDPSTPFQKQIHALLSLKMDAFLFMPTYQNEEVKEILTKSNCYPLQLFIDSFPEIDSVTVDDEQGCYLAAEELIRNDHKKIMLIDIANEVHNHRRNGFIKALSEHNIDFDENMILALNDQNFDSHLDQIHKAIDEYKPTGIISVTNNLTQNVVFLLRQENKQVGKDISLIMYDESDWAKLENITTVSQSLYDIIEKILEFLSDDNNTVPPQKAKKAAIVPKLDCRGSVVKL